MSNENVQEKNQVLLDQFKRKKTQYEKSVISEITKLANFYKSHYEDVNEISEDTISKLFVEKVESEENDNLESIKIMNKILEYQHGVTKIDYLLERNRYDENGVFDSALSISELTSTKEKAKLICIKMGIEKIRQTSQTITSIYKSLSEQNADFKIRYEIQKQFMCNKYGYTPESFDKYFEAIKEYNAKQYDEKGSNVIKGAFVHSNSINEKFKHLLIPVENWDGETVVYKSEFLERYKQHYDKMEKERPRGTEGEKLYNEFLEMNKNIVLKNMPGYKPKENNTTRMGERILDKNRDSLKQKRLERRKNKNIQSDEITEVVVKEEPIIQETKPSVNYDELFEIKDTNKEESIIEEVIETKEEMENNSTVIPEEEVKVEEIPAQIIEEDLVKEPEVKTREVRNVDYDFEQVFEKVEKPADISILRSNNPDKLRKYNESYKYGRLLYLPYSGYEVLVKRIVDRGQLSYILELLQTSKLATDLTVELEIIRVLYSNLEFFFDIVPNEIDFYKNLSIRDIPLIITTMALISQKEDKDGNVIVDIDRIVCANDDCQKKISLEHPIKLDLKKSFAEIYPIELYYSNYHIYKEKNYKSIYEAYSNSIDGKLERVVYDDDNLNYSCIYGNTTFYNTSEPMNKKVNELIYQIFKDDLEQMSESDIEKEFPMLDIKDYIKDKYLIELQLRYEELLRDYPDIEEESKINDKDREEDEKEIINEYKHLRALFNKLDYNLNELNNMISVISNIRSLKIKIKATNEEVINVNTDDMYQLFNTVTSLPQDMYKEILNLYVKYQKEMTEYDYKKTFIKLYSEDIAGLIKTDSVLKSREEFIDYINNKYQDEEIRKQWLETYDLSLDNLNKGLCTCGHDEYYVNHFNLLFFSIIKQMGVKTSQD